LIDFLGQLGPRPHMVGDLPAVGVGARGRRDHVRGQSSSRPATLTLMAGRSTQDSADQGQRIRQEQADQLVRGQSDQLRAVSVQGAFRKVYPGFVQLTAFVSMNLERHIKQHMDLHNHLAKGETEKAATIKTFYDEYFAVMDCRRNSTSRTVRDVFQEHLLPQGKLTFRGRTVDPAAVRRMGLMTVEGERDDICSIGQTLAAQELCTGVRAYRRVHHMQAGVGHYGGSAVRSGTTRSIRCCGISCTSIPSRRNFLISVIPERAKHANPESHGRSHITSIFRIGPPCGAFGMTA